jgi:hypothetical protein
VASHAAKGAGILVMDYSSKEVAALRVVLGWGRALEKLGRRPERRRTVPSLSQICELRIQRRIARGFQREPERDETEIRVHGFGAWWPFEWHGPKRRLVLRASSRGLPQPQVRW